MKCVLILLTFILAGCSSFKPGRNTLATVAGVLEAERRIMTSWANYVVAEEKRIAALPAEDQGYAAAELLKSEGRVQQAHGAFVKARIATERAMTALAQLPTKTAPPADLLVAFSNLVTVTAQ